MKLLAPVSSLDSAIKQINAGAGEIYLGGDTDAFNNLSFSGRGKFNPNMEKLCPGYEEIKEIVTFAHSKDVTVMYAANLPFLADDVDSSGVYTKHFLDYIETGLKAGVDSLIIADIGAILLLREKGIETHITASTFLETINLDQILFLKEIGVNRAVLSYQVVMPEIEKLSKLSPIEIEVFGHFGCSFYDGYCNLKHFFGEKNDSGIGIPCQNVYSLEKNGEKIASGQILNSSLVCGICSIPKLKELGVYALKLVGRARNVDQNVEITSIYSQVLKRIEKKEENRTNDQEFLQLIRDEILPRWWTQGLCRNNLCKYKMNHVTKAFVGL